MKKCDYCGLSVAGDAEACPRCGTSFRPRDDGWEPLVDEETSTWLLNTFAWALEQWAVPFYTHIILVTPSPAHFPEGASDPQQRVVEMFNQVRAHAGLQSWPCKLVAQTPDLNPTLAPLIHVANAPRSPYGTFGRAEGSDEVEITYNPVLVSQPQALVAVLAHELAHYVGYSAKLPLPGGEKNMEYATDLLAVFMGFGIFLANSAVNFRQFSGIGVQGWSSSSLGYLTEFEFVYCLAVFCALKGLRLEHVKPYLKPFLLPVFENCVRSLAQKPEAVARLKAIKNELKPAPSVRAQDGARAS